MGCSFLIGPASGYRHAVHDYGPDTSDEIAIVNVFGPTLELIVLGKGARIHLEMTVYGDMAAVHSGALRP